MQLTSVYLRSRVVDWYGQAAKRAGIPRGAYIRRALEQHAAAPQPLFDTQPPPLVLMEDYISDKITSIEDGELADAEREAAKQ